MGLVVLLLLTIVSVGLAVLVTALVTVGVLFQRLPADARGDVSPVFWVLVGVQAISLIGLWPVALLGALPTLAAVVWAVWTGDRKLRGMWLSLGVAACSWLGILLIGGVVAMALLPVATP